MAADLAGKVFLVTGATEGIGLAAARDFARRGATLVIVGRNKEKTERVRAELAGFVAPGGSVDLLLGDMSKLADIRAVAAAFKAKHDRLDVLVNNAGAVFDEYRTTADGFEQTFALNHLAYFLLSVELEELLRRTPGSRVVSTSSAAHRMGNLRLDNVARRPDRSAGFGVYGESKLANILFTREFAKRLGPGHAVNCFHPGFVRTGFAMNTGSLLKNGTKLFGSLFARTPEKGAETLIWLATSPDAASHTGEYFADRKVARRSGAAKNEELARGLWTLSEECCGLSAAARAS